IVDYAEDDYDDDIGYMSRQRKKGKKSPMRMC
ncbi:hypothetical protein LCGC14_2146580, partial [marine sediment metagenome]